MAPNQDIKVCPLCAETIKAAAKVCPFCRTPQPGFARWRQYLVLILSVLTMLAVLVVLCLAYAWLFPDVFRSEGLSFASHRADLIVMRTSLERDATKGEFWLSGYVTNAGGYPWRVKELEVRFLSREGNLVDVRRAEVSESFLIQPQQEQAFRVGLGRLIFTNSGIAERVRVQTATDGNRPIVPD
ncbi:MAG TPA: hypothetical protein VNZ64_24975 [Candidatus Acidoferrum sp.]|nr:hypothetical protein [Candidatus Acidoferrum sp.]